MQNHKYRVSVSYIEDREGNPVEGRSLEFVVGNHDEILGIVERIRNTKQFEGDDAAAFAIGLKLFGEVMLKNKDNPLFSELRPQFVEFMKKLKSTVKNG